MKNLCHKYLGILQVEIEDLKDDLNLFLGVLQDRHERRVITDYVFAENSAILRNEILGLDECIRAIAGCVDFEDESIDNVREMLKQEIGGRLDQHGYVPAVKQLLIRKLDKIAAYLRLNEPAPSGAG